MRRGLVCTLVGVSALSLAQYPGAVAVPKQWKIGFNSIVIPDAKRLLTTIAGPDFMGRNPSQPGYPAAAGYVAQWLQIHGIAPAFSDGYFQKFEVQELVPDAKSCMLQTEDGTEKLEYLKDFTWSLKGELDAKIPVVFIRAVKGKSLSGLDRSVMKGALLILGSDTLSIDPDGRAAIMRANSEGSLGAIAVVTPSASTTTFSERRFTSFKSNESLGVSALATISVSEAAARRLAKVCGATNYLAEAPTEATAEVGKVKLVAKASAIGTVLYTTMNVVGKIEGSDPSLKNEAVVIGSHLDHLGVSSRGTYFGADDNGSGSTANMLVARAVALNSTKPKRSVIFGFWSLEEAGLYGSQYYADHPAMPMEKTVAYLNMDMVGRNAEFKAWNDLPEYNTDSVYASSVKLNSPDLYKLVHQTNRFVNLLVRDDKEDRTGRSDTRSFYEKGVPTLKAFTGEHADYHKPTDTVDKVNFEKLTNVAKWIYLTAETLAQQKERPNYVRGARYVMGQVSYLPKIALTPKATVEVSLVDVSKADGKAEVIDTTTIPKPGQIPVRFALRYEPNKLIPGHGYAIQARILEGGRVVFATTKDYRVLEDGASSRLIEIIVDPVK